MPVSLQNVSRRGFLQCSLAVGAAVALPRGLMAARELSLSKTDALPKSNLPICDDIALISDVHVSGGILPSPMGKNLSTAIEQVLALEDRPQTAMIAGDCAHLTGGTGDYKEYVRRIQPLIAAKMPLHMTMGNHDQRDRFWDVLPDEQSESNAKLRRQSMVVECRHANWLLLDSLNKTNFDAGELGRDQLDWLAAELDARADKPAIVMLHHDPIRNGKKGSLADSDQLMDIVRPRRQVKALFWGHTHIWDVSQDVSGIHMVNLPATGYTLWGRSFLGWASCKMYRDDAMLTVHALHAGEGEDGRAYMLKWRAA